MAAELAKVSLWLEASSPADRSSFLDAHIKVGNALLGTTPGTARRGHPRRGVPTLVGDDRAW